MTFNVSNLLAQAFFWSFQTPKIEIWMYMNLSIDQDIVTNNGKEKP